MTRVISAISAANAQYAKERKDERKRPEWLMYDPGFGGQLSDKSMTCRVHVCADSAQAQDFHRSDNVVVVQNNKPDSPCVALMTAMNRAKNGDHFIVITKMQSLKEYRERQQQQPAHDDEQKE